jgi:hypothetical protein
MDQQPKTRAEAIAAAGRNAETAREQVQGFAREIRELHCANCMCPYSFSEPQEGPQGTCLEELCPCHTAYWQTVPESVKRRRWGDR